MAEGEPLQRSGLRPVSQSKQATYFLEAAISSGLAGWEREWRGAGRSASALGAHRSAAQFPVIEQCSRAERHRGGGGGQRRQPHAVDRHPHAGHHEN